MRRVEHKKKRNIGILKIHSESSKDFKSAILLLPPFLSAPGCRKKQVADLLYKHALKWFGDVTSDLHNPFFNFSYASLSFGAQGIANGKGIIISESYPGNHLSFASFLFVSDRGLLGVLELIWNIYRKNSAYKASHRS